PLSEERRKQLAARVGKMAEEAKVTLRNARRDGNRLCDVVEKAKSVSEDDIERTREEVQGLLKTYEEKVDVLVKKKTAEIMEIGRAGPARASDILALRRSPARGHSSAGRATPF